MATDEAARLVVELRGDLFADADEPRLLLLGQIDLDSLDRQVIRRRPSTAALAGQTELTLTPLELLDLLATLIPPSGRHRHH